jgi:hypothetical protein
MQLGYPDPILIFAMTQIITRPGQMPSGRYWKEVDKRVLRRGRLPAIPPYSPRRLIQNQLVLFYCRNVESKPQWTYGGQVIAKLDGPRKLTLQTADFARFPVYLNRLQILQIPTVETSFSLEVQPARWHKELFFQVWEYRAFSESKAQKLGRVEDKQDAIISELARLGLALPSDYSNEDPNYDE